MTGYSGAVRLSQLSGERSMLRFAVRPRLLVGAVLAVLASTLLVQSAGAVSADLVVSQVYGGGGNASATYTHDYIEIFNRGTGAVSLAGMSLQYASATGTGNFGATTTQADGAQRLARARPVPPRAGGHPTQRSGRRFPRRDIVDDTPIAMAAGAGKVALRDRPDVARLQRQRSATLRRGSRWHASSTWSATATRTSSRAALRRPSRQP